MKFSSTLLLFNLIVTSFGFNDTNSTKKNAEVDSCEKNVKLFAISKKIGKVGITNYHEGAGINYLFLTGSDSPEYIFNKCTKQIYILLDNTYQQFLNENNGLVQLTVAGPNGEFYYEINEGNKYLTLNGDKKGWLACKDTNDPYNYSKNLYQLSYLGGSFSVCENISVIIEY